MREQIAEKYAEFRAKMKKHDEALIELINVKTRDAILKIIKDYLQQHES